MNKIKRVSTFIVDIPLKRPHVMSLMTVKKVNFLFVRIEGNNGIEGWGEAAFLGGPTWSEESVESAQAVVSTYVAPFLIGKDFTRIEKLRAFMGSLVRGNHFALAAIEIALFDLVGKTKGVPVYDLLGGKVWDKIPLSWSLASGSIADEEKEAQKFIDHGHFIFKFKTGLLTPEKDIARIKNIRNTFGPDLRLRIDANQGWDKFNAIRAIKGMEPYNLDFAEQPVPKNDIESLISVSQSVNVPILADESLGSIQEASQLVKSDAVSMFGIKLTKAGGLLGAKRLAAIAEGACFPCYVGCMIETGIGNAAYLHFAVSTPQITMGCELFGPLLLADTVTNEEPKYENGYIWAPDEKPGLGFTINETQFKKFQRCPSIEIK